MNTLIGLGVFFYFMDKTLYPCKNKLSLKMELMHLIHNIGSIIMYLGPFLIKDKTILTLILIGAGFVLVQGAVSKNRDQKCFLMPIYNRECGLEENRSLFDIMSIMGIKRLLTSEQFQYFYYIIQLLLYSIILLKIFQE